MTLSRSAASDTWYNVLLGIEKISSILIFVNKKHCTPPPQPQRVFGLFPVSDSKSNQSSPSPALPLPLPELLPDPKPRTDLHPIPTTKHVIFFNRIQRRRNRTLLRVPGSGGGSGVLVHGGGVRDGEERSWGGVDGSDASGAGDEVDSPGCYGWSVGYLWPYHSCHY